MIGLFPPKSTQSPIPLGRLRRDFRLFRESMKNNTRVVETLSHRKKQTISEENRTVKVSKK